MIDLTTQNPPRVFVGPDGVYMVVAFTLPSGEVCNLTAPLGDGKYHMERTLTAAFDYGARRNAESLPAPVDFSEA